MRILGASVESRAPSSVIYTVIRRERIKRRVEKTTKKKTKTRKSLCESSRMLFTRSIHRFDSQDSTTKPRQISLAYRSIIPREESVESRGESRNQFFEFEVSSKIVGARDEEEIRAGEEEGYRPRDRGERARGISLLSLSLSLSLYRFSASCSIRGIV
jgi:hypothetical protein